VLPEPPEWQVRTVLRFLLNAQPPLIVRERNKYRPLRPSKLGMEAKQLWQTVAKGRSKVGGYALISRTPVSDPISATDAIPRNNPLSTIPARCLMAVRT